MNEVENVCQWSIEDEVYYRDTDGKVYHGIVNAVDIPTRRLRIVTGNGRVVWVYMEQVWKV